MISFDFFKWKLNALVTRSYEASVKRDFLLILVHRIDCNILLRCSLCLPYILNRLTTSVW